MNNIIEFLLLYYKIQSKILIGVFSFLSFIYIKFIQSSYLILTSLLIVTRSISLSYNLSVIKFNVESIKNLTKHPRSNYGSHPFIYIYIYIYIYINIYIYIYIYI